MVLSLERVIFRFAAVGLLGAPGVLSAQTAATWEERLECCTSIMVGRAASADGSVMTSHSCDGGIFRSWLNVVPRKKHEKGAKRTVWSGSLHTETPEDLQGKKQKGDIPQVPETHGYINTGYPIINDKQLAMGETTFGGRKELANDKGLFLIEELQAIAMERCATAREAIRLMGSLAEEHGYADMGECLTVADPKEVWHFEIQGAGKDRIGAVWAAVRIPDDHVGVSANLSRIPEIDLNQPDRYMASKNVFSLAKEKGWWDPAKGPFKFWKAYSDRKSYDIREYFIMSTLAPSLNLKMGAEEMPFSVKAEKKIAITDMFAMFRQTYEGTEHDKTKNLYMPKPRKWGEPPLKEGEKPEIIKSPIANPWMHADLVATINHAKADTVPKVRTIAAPQCAYSHITQCRSWLPDSIGGLVWFSFDNPGQSPRIPIFCGVKEMPKSFEVCMNKRYRTDSAGWWFRRANRLAQVCWGKSKDIKQKAIQEFENRGLEEVPLVEKKIQALLKSEAGQDKTAEVLAHYTRDFATSAMHRWWEMGDQFWGMFGKGF